MKPQVGPLTRLSNRISGGGHHYRRFAKFAILAAVLLLLLACSTGKQSTWDPVGPVAERQLLLFNVLLWVMVVVFILVEGVLVYAAIRYRKRPGQALPNQTHGNMPLEIAWTIIPTILIMALGIWSVVTLYQFDEPPASADILHVNVTGHQWWFEFEYEDAGGGKRIVTANELKIPVDRAVRLTLESDDVLHSFWVPKLAGKVDVVPTRTNHMWFQADSDKIDSLPATFHGQCAEFCGIAHALMKFRVRVLDQQDYDSWVRNYGPPPATTDQAEQGKRTFGQCAMCHSIDGENDSGAQASRKEAFITGGALSPAPNLTDLRTRESLAAGLLDLNKENLKRWLRNPDEVKPGNHMKARAAHLYGTGELSLNDDDLDAVVAYLLNLQ
ncbi:MAG: cytochrome c oxidase subunit II [SAR202 cluster bacterium Io17-Chloro-G6]|nr:MAG: cytochrome c oxidase subunit II [SAR202 cluster bacterium Io17-Chloro-G6]